MTAGRSLRRPVVLAALGVALVAVILAVAFVPLGRTDPARVVIGGSPLYGKPAPPIDLPTLDGESVRLSDLRGRPVLVNIWASWCLPCRDVFPMLVDVYARYHDDGLEILGIVHDDDPEAARRFASDYGATWPMLDDAQDVVWRDYLGVGVPQSYFIDRDGVVQAFSLGPFTEAGLTAQLATIVPPSGERATAEPSPSSVGPS
jgi:cytochrome c biogenesis protein CcmG/thiol:disulfide interchange protein DsbE